ncbi:MAG: hypothetical protein HY042_13135 [Spirochaetia bacterium]|nr:hypothetical protein [Spirochaetia bacterium]
MRPSRAIIYALLTFLLALGQSPSAKSKSKGGDDEGRIAYEMAASLLLAGETDKAKARFNDAMGAGGRYADLARLEMVRILARDTKTQNRSTAVKQILSAVEDEAMKPRVTFAAAAALYGSGELDGALELLLDLSLRLPADRGASDAVLLSAQIYYDKRQWTAALERGLFLISQYPKSIHVSRAYELIAAIYWMPGPEYSPIRARRALELAEEKSVKSASSGSPDNALHN